MPPGSAGGMPVPDVGSGALLGLWFTSEVMVYSNSENSPEENTARRCKNYERNCEPDEAGEEKNAPRDCDSEREEHEHHQTGYDRGARGNEYRPEGIHILRLTFKMSHDHGWREPCCSEHGS